MSEDAVFIAGAGSAGMTLACFLGTAGIKCVLAERGPAPENRRDLRAEALSDPAVYEAICKEDPRASAIAAGTMALWDKAGIKSFADPFAAPINDILVTDGDAPSFLHWNKSANAGEPMGYMMPNALTLAALRARLAELRDTVTVRYNMAVTRFEETAYGADAVNADGGRTPCALPVVCDGRRSVLRETCGIGARYHDYKQTALVCTVTHEKPHHGLAQERFFPDGPFATLPLSDPHMSAIVWTLPSSDIHMYREADDPALLEELNAAAGTVLGAFTAVFARAYYPLNMVLAKRYYAGRVILAGDAAHGIHPLAGQGYNLAARGLGALSDAIISARDAGLPLHDAGVYTAYAAARAADVPGMAAFTHAVNGVFASPSKTVTSARRATLTAIEKCPPVKNALMRRAMGT